MLCSAAVHLKQSHNQSRRRAAGFTLVEALISIAILGVGVACIIGALTKMNQIASTSRNMTGAQTAITGQIDLFQSVGPFTVGPSNTQNLQIPKDGTDNTYDMTIGTHTIDYKDPVDPTQPVSSQWPVYQYGDSNNVVRVNGTLTETVTALTSAFATTTDESLAAYHQAVFTITYTYLNRTYSFSMSTIRTSDT